jgi:flagellar export protein FliJ
MKRTQPDRLATLLKLRRRREEGAGRTFAAARQELEIAASRIERLKQARDAHNAAAREALLAGRRAILPACYRRMLAEINQELGEQAKRLAAASVELERRRWQLVEARGQRKAMESLKDRLAGQVAARQRRSEVGTLDELHTARMAATRHLAAPVGLGAHE